MASIKIEIEDLPNGKLGVTFTPTIKDFAYDFKLANRNPSEAEALGIAIAYFIKERDKRAKQAQRGTLKDMGIWTPGSNP